MPEASVAPKLAFWLAGTGTALAPVPGANETFLEPRDQEILKATRVRTNSTASVTAAPINAATEEDGSHVWAVLGATVVVGMAVVMAALVVGALVVDMVVVLEETRRN